MSTITAGDVTSVVGEIQAAGDTILTIIEGAAPGVALEAGAAETVLDLIAEMAMKALTAWSAASGIPITAESVLALLPNQTPLTAPDPVAPQGGPVEPPTTQS